MSNSAGGGCGASRRAIRCTDAALFTASRSPLSASVTVQQSSVLLAAGARPSQRPSISHPSVICSPQQQTTVGSLPMSSQAYMACACPPSPSRTRTATNRLIVGEVRRKRMRRMIAALVRFREYVIPHTAAVQIPRSPRDTHRQGFPAAWREARTPCCTAESRGRPRRPVRPRGPASSPRRKKRSGRYASGVTSRQIKEQPPGISHLTLRTVLRGHTESRPNHPSHGNPIYHRMVPAPAW